MAITHFLSVLFNMLSDHLTHEYQLSKYSYEISVHTDTFGIQYISRTTKNPKFIVD